MRGELESCFELGRGRWSGGVRPAAKGARAVPAPNEGGGVGGARGRPPRQAGRRPGPRTHIESVEHDAAGGGRCRHPAPAGGHGDAVHADDGIVGGSGPAGGGRDCGGGERRRDARSRGARRHGVTTQDRDAGRSAALGGARGCVRGRRRAGLPPGPRPRERSGAAKRPRPDCPSPRPTKSPPPRQRPRCSASSSPWPSRPLRLRRTPRRRPGESLARPRRPTRRGGHGAAAAGPLPPAAAPARALDGSAAGHAVPRRAAPASHNTPLVAHWWRCVCGAPCAVMGFMPEGSPGSSRGRGPPPPACWARAGYRGLPGPTAPRRELRVIG